MDTRSHCTDCNRELTPETRRHHWSYDATHPDRGVVRAMCKDAKGCATRVRANVWARRIARASGQSFAAVTAKTGAL